MLQNSIEFEKDILHIDKHGRRGKNIRCKVVAYMRGTH